MASSLQRIALTASATEAPYDPKKSLWYGICLKNFRLSLQFDLSPNETEVVLSVEY